MQEVSIRPADGRDPPRLAEVLSEAFPDKLAAVFGRKQEEGRKALESHYRSRRTLEGVFVAEVGDRVVGTIELALMGREGEGSLIPFLRYLGVLRGLRAITALTILDRPLQEDECFVHQLAVTPRARGHGIGRMLIERGERYAREEGKRRLNLLVAGDNGIARGLYRRAGFEEVSNVRTVLGRMLLGKEHWILMRKPLVPD